jgi:hypothetical protein
MKKTVLMLLLLSCSFLVSAQEMMNVGVNVFLAAGRNDLEGVKLSRQLVAHLLNSDKEFVERDFDAYAPYIRTVRATFKHQGKTFYCYACSDMSQEASVISVINESFLQIRVLNSENLKEEAFFSDVLLNGSWDEAGNAQLYYTADDTYPGPVYEKYQKKFISVLKEALLYFD